MALPYAYAHSTADLDARWERVQAWAQARYGRAVTLEALLFLLGVQARGHGYEPGLEKETKQALIMEGTYCALASVGLYERTGMDADGAWIWARTHDLPDLPVAEQEALLKLGIVTYFEQHHPDLL